MLLQEPLEVTRGVLQKYWKELCDRLNPGLIIDELYQAKVLHPNDLEDIRSEGPRHKKAVCLLDKMRLRSLGSIRYFIEVLTRTEGIEDVGRDMLRDIDGANA